MWVIQMAKKTIDIGAIQAAIAQYQREREYQEAIRQSNNEKIRRLEYAKSIIATAKQNVYQYRSEFYSVYSGIGSDTRWTGNVKNNVHNCANYEIWNNYGTYYTNVDATLDAICDAITQLENDNYQRGLVIGGLLSQINSLANMIEKYWN